MNFYIDFDHTLYNTNKFIDDLINSIANYIIENGDFKHFATNFKKIFPDLEPFKINKNIDSIKDVLKDNFKRPEETYLKIEYNIFILANNFCKLFSCDFDDLKLNINNIIENGEKYLFTDSLHFLKNLKKSCSKVYILSHEKNDLDFQAQKILGSGIFSKNYIDAIILSKISKAKLTKKALTDKENIYIASPDNIMPDYIDYENGIFIDDRPKDLENLYFTCYGNKLPKKNRIYRIERPNQKYTNSSFSENFKFGTNIKIIHNFNELNIPKI